MWWTWLQISHNDDCRAWTLRRKAISWQAITCSTWCIRSLVAWLVLNILHNYYDFISSSSDVFYIRHKDIEFYVVWGGGGGRQSTHRHLLRKFWVFDMSKISINIESHIRSKTLFLYLKEFCISRSRAGCKNASKNIISSWSYEFFKSGSQYKYYTVQTLNRDISKQLKEHFFEKTLQARGLKLGCFVPLISFYKLISGIFEKNWFLWPKMDLKMCQNQFFADISKCKGLGA